MWLAATIFLLKRIQVSAYIHTCLALPPKFYQSLTKLVLPKHMLVSEAGDRVPFCTWISAPLLRS